MILYVVTVCKIVNTHTVKNMQRSGTEATRTQIQPSKPKRETTNIYYKQSKYKENIWSTE